MDFETLLKDFRWRPIRNCPGRFILARQTEAEALDRLLEAGPRPRVYPPGPTPDTVLVRAIEGGGVISYQKRGGRHLHTLNTPEGFHRKLRQLGIETEDTTAMAERRDKIEQRA